jgi:4a-hydroxytetrahydrobiopterin dehydratase
MSDLAKMDCVPCKGDVPALKGEDLKLIQERLGGDWKVVEEHHLEKEFTFKDFAGALEFTNRIGAIAEQQGHHPDICLGWGYVRVSIHTHKIDGLTESDFVLAAKFSSL